MKKVNGAIQLMRRSTKLPAYTPIPNEFIADADVSAEARLLIVYLLTLPSDWVMYISTTAKKLKMGRNRLYRIIKELTDAGYMKRTKVSHKGRFKHATQYSYLPEFLKAEEPKLHNVAPSNETQLQKVDTSNGTLLHPRLPNVDTSNGTLLNNKAIINNEYIYNSIVELKLDEVELPVDKIKSVDEKTTQEAGSVSSLVRVVDPNGSKTNVKAPTVNDLTSGAMKVAGSKKSLVEEIFEAWKEKLKHPKAKLDVKRRALIEKALRDYSDSDIIQAFDGCSKTPHNMGDNDRGEVYDGLHIILRDSEQIERFMRNSENPPKPRSRDKAQEKRDRKDDIQNQMVKSCQDLAERFKQQNQRKEKEVHGEICGQDPRGLMWPN